MISYIIIVLLIITLIIFVISAYNKLVILKLNTNKSFANIDVLLKQRADEIPNLIKVIKENTRYEEATLIKLTKLRTDFLNSSNTNDKVKTSNDINAAIKSIFLVSENYPELKSNTNFMRLQMRVSEVEDAIVDRREYYNESINMYNIGIKEFPALILAKLIFYKEKELLQISEDEKKYDGIKF